MSKSSSFFKSIFFINLFIFSSITIAQEIEEVIVTATKKSESIQDLAFSIEAFDADQLAQEQIFDLIDLQEVVPGFISDKGVASGGQYAMRGLLSRNVSAASVDSVSLNVNGHNINASSLINIGFFDLERIEIKKGPVGTLNGRSGALGKIDLITARPTNELEGSIDIEAGNYNSKVINTVLNLPFNDSFRTRIAIMSKTRDGMMYNTYLNSEYDDHNEIAGRFSFDWDISDRTELKFTYTFNESDDSRTQQDALFCAPDQFFGCSPFSRGSQGQGPDTRGEVDGVLGFVSFAEGSAITNKYANTGANAEYGRFALNRNPDHQSKNEFTNLELNHSINDSLQFVAKYSYGTRKFDHIDDNDMSVASVPYVGLFGPVAGEVCFRDFCEFVDSARKYSMIHIDYHNQNAELNLISDYDGPINFTVGVYNYSSKNDNETNIQTGAGGFLTDIGTHPFFPAFSSFSGGAITAGQGGAVFFQDILQWANALQIFGPTDPRTAGALGLALANSTRKTTPADAHGLILDSHIKIDEKSIFGELYLDLSEATKLTVGMRYDEADVRQAQINDGFGALFHELPGTVDTKLIRNQRDVPGLIQSQDSPADGTAYKIAIQHDLNDSSMIYGSVSTAMKPGGVNTGNDVEALQEENVTNFDLGIKSILMNGAILLNTTIFNVEIDGYQIGTVGDLGTNAHNAFAEMTGWEGNLSAFLNESTRIDFNWLLTDAEFTKDTLIVDLLNPGAWSSVAAYLGGVDAAFGNAGVYTAAVGNTGTRLFKSAGFSCLNPDPTIFSPLTGDYCPDPFRGVPQNINGNDLPGTPELSYSLSFNKTFTSSVGTVDLKLTYRYQDSFAGDAFNSVRAYNDEQSYIDVLMRYEPNNGDWYAGLYAKNIEDERYLTTPAIQSNVQGGGIVWQMSDPTVYGLQFGTDF